MGAYEYLSDCNGNGVPDDQDVASGASEDRNGNGIPDECDEPVDRRAVRSFAVECVASRSLTVIIDVWLDASAGTYALEETPPPDWTVLGISHDGVFDPLTGKVKWGPFFDGEEMQERFWYSMHLALPQVDPESEFCFGPGTLSVDGEGLSIEGRACVATCRQHPADDDGDWRVVIDEVTSYGRCWQRGCEWAFPPVPIPIGYVTRAGFLWRNGESYCRNPGVEPPLGWVPCFGEDALRHAVRAAGSAAAAAGDADQIPDGWEILRGLATGVKNEGDSDGDGASDLAEYGAGTDPLDAGDVFAIESARILQDELIIGFKGRAGRRYRLSAGRSAAQPMSGWQPLPLQVEAATDGEPVELTVPLADLPAGAVCLRATAEPIE